MHWDRINAEVAPKKKEKDLKKKKKKKGREREMTDQLN